MNAIPAPSVPEPATSITPELVEKIRQFSSESERIGQLHPEQLELIYRQNWFKIFVPRAYGGLEHALPDGLRLLEALAWADGALGWVATLCGGANWFIGFLPPNLAALLFADEKVCLAGSGRNSGTAVETGGEFYINGQWKYATGAPHATAFTANCIISGDDQVRPGRGGNPQSAAFLFLPAEVRLYDDWRSMGMIATASRSFSVHQQWLPAERMFLIGEQYAVLPQAVYRYPFLLFALTTLSVNIAGMAARFLALCNDLLEDRVNAGPGDAGVYAEALARLRSTQPDLDVLRRSFYHIVEKSWGHCDAGGIIPQEIQLEVIAACRQLTAIFRKRVAAFFPFCGMVAANPAMEINRVWRNLHTASLHTLLVDDGYDIRNE